MKITKWQVGIASAALGVVIAGACGGGDVKPGEPDKRSGTSVKPGALCKTAGATGSYNRVWYVCKEDRNGDLRWVKR